MGSKTLCFSWTFYLHSWLHRLLLFSVDRNTDDEPPHSSFWWQYWQCSRQAICRDAFHGPELSKVYSTIGSALALFPALGPLCGGLIAEFLGWTNIFLVLAAFAFFLTFLVARQLPETHPSATRQNISFAKVLVRLARDKKVWGFGLIVGGCNGILFSYFAEGPFYLIKKLHLSPTQYGLTFIALALSTMAGGMTSKKLHKNHASQTILHYGLWIVMLATTTFSFFALVHHSVWSFDARWMIFVTLVSQMMCAFGNCMTISNALALALLDHRETIGTASSVFGFFYYLCISAFTFFMGSLHNGTLLPMPLYFLSISLLMVGVSHVCLREPEDTLVTLS